MPYPVAGIVAEYNPLHCGHLHHIKKARELCVAEAVIVVLSSDFVQRGEPALLDKWTRTEMALRCGVDLVVELPVIFSSHNAGVFADAAVDLLAATGVVTHLSFGAENPDCLMDSIVDILLKEPEPFKPLLKKHLDSGLSYVEARARAAEEMHPGSAAALAGSNNTLALAYLARIKKKNYDIQPLPVKRIGAAYNSTGLEHFASATAIRLALKNGAREEALRHLPPEAEKILANALKEGRACTGRDTYWKLLRAVLLRTKPEALAKYAEISEGIEYKMIAAALEAKSFEEWCGACTSKRYPAGRIRRSAVHTLLGLDHWTNRAAQRLGPPYIRALGMNAAGRALLREMRDRAALPVVTTYGKTAQASPYAAKTARYEALACELWEELIPNGRLGGEHKRRIIMV
ncbi:MAG: nucleotidyltransferase family protein [bacterium]|nr:nucleotidyltransferase family protein [bacterium]